MEFVEKYYAEDIAERKSAESKWAERWHKEVTGNHVLDIGCGPQFFDDALSFGSLPKEIIGVDLNETNIEFLKTSKHPGHSRAKQTLLDQGVQFEFLVGDIKVEKPEFTARFDAVFASGVLGMFDEPDTRHILSLMYEYLQLGGLFVMVSWGDDRLSPAKFAQRNDYGWYWRKGPHPEAFGQVLEQTGFTILKSDSYVVPNPNEYEWGLIYAFVARKSFRSGHATAPNF